MALPSPTPVAAITGYIPAGRRRYVWCSTIASIGAPTSAEITAGQDITGWVKPDAISGFSSTSAFVDDPNMLNRKTAKVPGMITYEDSSMGMRQSVSGGNDWRTVFHRDDVGYMCVFPEGIIASSKMSIYLCTVGNATSENGSGADLASGMVSFAVTDAAENIATPTA